MKYWFAHYFFIYVYIVNVVLWWCYKYFGMDLLRILDGFFHSRGFSEVGWVGSWLGSLEALRGRCWFLLQHALINFQPENKANGFGGSTSRHRWLHCYTMTYIKISLFGFLWGQGVDGRHFEVSRRALILQPFKNEILSHQHNKKKKKKIQYH